MSDSSPRRLLMLAHPFPPTATVAVQRTLKFLRYLPEHGWRPEVVTVRPGVYGQEDPRLLERIPSGVPVTRTRTLEPRAGVAGGGEATASPRDLASPPVRHPAAPGTRSIGDGEGEHGWGGGGAEVRRLARGLLGGLARSLYRIVPVPDASVGWVPFAVAAGVRRGRVARPDAIYATGNPFSSFIAAAALGRLLGVPYVLDYRDAWMLNHYRAPKPRPREWLEAKEEGALLGGAAAALFATEPIRQDYAAVYPGLAERFVTLTNGLDPEDFAGLEPEELEGFAFVHAGKFTAYRRPEAFLRAFAAVRADDAGFARAARAVFVGDLGEGGRALARELGIGDAVVDLGQRPHRESLRLILGAGSPLLVGGGDRTEQTGKVFEYLYARRPILALVPEDGAAADVVRHSPGGGYFAPPGDAGAIAAAIRRLYADWGDRPTGAVAGAPLPEQLTRRWLTARLAAVLEATVGGGAPALAAERMAGEVAR